MQQISNDKSIVVLESVKTLRETDAAIRVLYDGGIHWLPKSQCEDWPDEGETGDLIVKEWILKEKEII
jgi:hypothetical protein